jgi:CheY-like chemotaxis protein
MARVLVIDDDFLVAESIRRTLRGEHDVVVEQNPTVALERLRTGPAFDVILCDLSMPTLSGAALYAELASTHPDLAARIVFIAGSFSEHHLPDTPNRRIGKPYQQQMLRRVVNEVASGQCTPEPTPEPAPRRTSFRS